MATTNIAVTLDGLLTNPFVADDSDGSMQRFLNLLHGLVGAGSNAPGAVTLTANAAGVYATRTVTFSGAATAADTVTIGGTALTAAQKNATATATFSTIVAGNSITINGVTFTAAVAAANLNEFTLGADDTSAAAACAAAINAFGPLALVVTATSALGVVTIRAVTAGTAGNAITFTKVGAPITVTGSGFLANGAATANNAWDPGNTATTAAQALVSAINASSTAAVSGNVVATNVAGVVTLTARMPGPSANAVTLAKSGANIAVGGATLSGGTLGTAISLVF